MNAPGFEVFRELAAILVDPALIWVKSSNDNLNDIISVGEEELETRLSMGSNLVRVGQEFL